VVAVMLTTFAAPPWLKALYGSGSDSRSK